LTGDEGDCIEAVGGERAADQPVFQQQHRAQRAAAEDGHGQQRAAGRVGEVGVAGEAVVGAGVGHEQGLNGVELEIPPVLVELARDEPAIPDRSPPTAADR